MLPGDHIDTDERRRRVGVRHLLAPNSRAKDLATVAGALVGLHSSDPASVFLSARARMSASTIEGIEDEMYVARTVARVLGMRRTMFVVPLDLIDTLDQGVVAAMVDAERRRLAGYIEKEGIASDGDRWVERVKRLTLAALEARGTAVAGELKQDVPELSQKITFGEGKKWGGAVGVSTRILFLLATEGAIIRAKPRGSWLSSQYRWALRSAWTGTEATATEPAAARRRLLERWLSSFGPGNLSDIRWWTGWSKRFSVQALDELETVIVGAQPDELYLLADDGSETPPVPDWASLLPALDPTPMGWKQRDWYLGDHAGELFDRNGNIGPTIWVNGRVVGGWAVKAPDELSIAMLEPVSTAQEQLIAREITSVIEFLEGAVVIPRFRTPLERRLLA